MEVESRVARRAKFVSLILLYTFVSKHRWCIIPIVFVLFASCASYASYASYYQFSMSRAYSQYHHFMESYCLRAPYPRTCMVMLSIDTTLGKVATHPTQLLQASVRATSKAIEGVREEFKGLLKSSDIFHMKKAQHGGITDCHEMFELMGINFGDLAFDVGSSRAVGLDRIVDRALLYQVICMDQLKSMGKSLEPQLMKQNLKINQMLTNILWLLKKDGNGEYYTEKSVPEWVQEANPMEWSRPKFTPNVTVAIDGTGNYSTISEAVSMAPLRSTYPFVIKIKPGIYREYVLIPSDKTNLRFIGESRRTTIVTGNRTHESAKSTLRSATFTVLGDGFTAEELTIMNTAGPEKHQAVALTVSAYHVAFYRCNFTGYQDTLYTHSGIQFYRHCIVEGTVDFIFGFASAVFQECQILVKRPLQDQVNVITAHRRTRDMEATGISIQNSIIGTVSDARWTIEATHTTYLGRPWSKFARVAILNCYLGHVIHPKGWTDWEERGVAGQTDYIEYENVGSGANIEQRVQWKGYRSQVSGEEAKKFTARVLISGSNWLSETTFPYDLDL